MDIGHILLTGVTFFVILSVLVLVHELGHFLAARRIGVKVEEFGFGLPPRIWGKQIGDVLYSVNWLPIGGFVKLAGEDQTETDEPTGPPEERRKFFWARSKLERSIILLAGVAMNYLLSLLLTVFMLPAGYPVSSDHTFVGYVVPGSPAESAGLIQNDAILSLQYTREGVPVTEQIETPQKLISTVNTHKGEAVTLTVLRSGTKMLITVVPRVDAPAGQGPMGVAISDIEVKKSTFPQSLPDAVAIKNRELWLMVSKIAQPFAKLLTFQSVCGELSGPIGIARVTGAAVQVGLQAVLYLASAISLNLAFLNILPIPALDGGRLAFILLEKFTKKKIRPSVESSAHQVGFIILLGFLLLISINDILCPQPLH